MFPRECEFSRIFGFCCPLWIPVPESFLPCGDEGCGTLACSMG